MNYTALRKSDFDSLFKLGKHKFSCYSMKKIREISPDGDFNIVGLTREYNGADDFTLQLNKNDRMSVISADMDTPFYKTIGYIPVEGYEKENEYIAVQKSRSALSVRIMRMFGMFRENTHF